MSDSCLLLLAVWESLAAAFRLGESAGWSNTKGKGVEGRDGGKTKGGGSEGKMQINEQRGLSSFYKSRN